MLNLSKTVTAIDLIGDGQFNDLIKLIGKGKALTSVERELIIKKILSFDEETPQNQLSLMNDLDLVFTWYEYTQAYVCEIEGRKKRAGIETEYGEGKTVQQQQPFQRR